MTRFTAHIAVLLAMVGVTTAAGCELIVGGHHVPGTGGSSTTTTTSETTGSTTGKGGTGGTGGSTGGSGGGTGGSTGGSGGGTGGSTGGSGGGTGGTGGGACTGAEMCPGVNDECQTKTCTGGTCGFDYKADGFVVTQGQTAADCLVLVCDGAGKIKTINDDNDPFDDGNDCTIDACDNGTPTNLPKAAGATCASSGGTLCDGDSSCVECLQNSDCVATTGYCSPQHQCVAATCGDGAVNGTETDVDCGGSCSTCGSGKLCLVATDCTDGVCSGTPATCQAPTCADGVDNGSETDIDCGGSCTTKCGPGKGCSVDGDCFGGSCSGTVCLPTCIDGVKNGSESDIDCGGASCNKCAVNKDCGTGNDCQSGVCTGGKCQAPTCNDNVKNATETDIDCGGGACPTCGNTKTCNAATDCASGVCSGTPKTCQAPSCTDNIKNGTETDTDCGGTCTTKCAVGKVCATGADCASNVCTGGICQSPACGDGVKSPGEGCDDHNTTNGDGCSSLCFTEFGFSCTGSPSVCTTTCGDGFKASTEGCDQGNIVNGDGCSSTCTVEAGYTCTGVAPSTCTTSCGDGIKVGTEACDDGDTVSGNGCSATCTVETGFACVGQGVGSCTPICGNGQKHGAEGCDDGNTVNGDGCSSTCQPEAGYTCTGVGAGSCKTNCGDGLKVGAEGCDDGNTTNGDGCSSTCTAEFGYTCTGQGAGSCTSTCGDGKKAANEQCDDGNTANGDGCSSTCVPETGYTCTGTQPSTCNTVCGDGVKAGAEACDDHNTASNDGCSATCTVEFGYTCTGSQPTTCTSTCGDGLKAFNEQCDDANTLNGDGCSATCAQEAGYTCVGNAPSVCSAGCGDGVMAGSESCDDGNNTDGDGCSSGCNVEPGWTCVGQGPGSCTSTCGDLIKVGAETCDDGNTVNGDGCSATCTTEPGWTCTGQGAGSCHPTCGDGVKVGGETCDDGNAVSGDGCSATCATETGYTCTGTGAGSCTTTCGDGIKAGTETCDDANSNNNDGCSSGCVVEPGYTCTGQGATSCKPNCGDGMKVGTEACDDANTVSGDGCSATCAIETGFACTGTMPSVCDGICGDGLVKGTEQCDDSNTVNGDCCSATCKAEAGCEIEPNNVIATANDFSSVAISNKVNGWVRPAGEKDFFKVTIPAGKVGKITAETITNFQGVVCTSATTNTDSVITIYNAAGTSLGTNDDFGTTYCSKLSLNPLAPGDYFIEVKQHSATLTLAYTLQVDVLLATCGNGVVEAAEQCDDSNTTNGDGCSSICAVEVLAEAEPNSTCALANGPYTLSQAGQNVLVGGSITPIGDSDWFKFTLTNYADVKFETFDSSGPPTCATIDTVIDVFTSDCPVNPFVSKDQGVTGTNCSRLDPTIDPAVKHMAPGTYVVKVTDYLNDGTINYRMMATVIAMCGNGIVEGSEQCDGGANCQSDCNFIPVCGNGFKDVTEQCDDNNTTPGDGCSATCQWEATAETESNNTCALANGPFVIPPPGSFGLLFSGTLNPPGTTSGDQDWYKFTLSNWADVKFETFDSTGPNNCVSGVDTRVALFQANCTTQVGTTQDNGGVGSCSKLDPTTQTTTKHLAPGTYNVRVDGFGTAAYGYMLKANLVALCGNGIVEGSENCDGGPGCAADCTKCGDGIVAGTEQCDDGNNTNGDGCNATCQYETTAEVESNNTCATANGPLTIATHALGTLVTGNLSGTADVDWYTITVPAYADLWIETYSAAGPGFCASLDTKVQLFAADCTTAFSTSQDNGGFGSCSRLNGQTQAIMRHVPPGTYKINVGSFTSASTNYMLQIKYSALCGNGIVEGTEQCDGGTNCNTACQWTTVPELEPNDTTAAADANAVTNPLLLLDGNRNITGGLTGTTDKDIYKLVVSANDTVVHLETYDSSGVDCRTAAPFSMAGHAVRILNSAGTVLVTDFESSSATGYNSTNNTNQSGIGVCAALLYRLDIGTYYVQVDKTAALASYFLSVRFHTNVGSEVEPNDTIPTATTTTIGRDPSIFGDHTIVTDTDYFAVTVPAGGAIRAEIIEGDTSKTCESLGVDSTLAIYNSAGTQITSTGGDAGRGYCSLIDGTGFSPSNSAAHNLAAGTYYISVVSFDLDSDAANLFKYRLVVNVGY